jgi:hypothetical protein
MCACECAPFSSGYGRRTFVVNGKRFAVHIADVENERRKLGKMDCTKR